MTVVIIIVYFVFLSTSVVSINIVFSHSYDKIYLK